MSIPGIDAIKKAWQSYHDCLIPEVKDGNIKSLDICKLSNEELEKMFYHFSLKKNQPFIDKNGLIPKIGKNSRGMDEKELIFFSYGLQGVIGLWDFWLKWRANKLFNPWYQKENKKTVEAFRNRTISPEAQSCFFKEYGIRRIKNASLKGLMSSWDEEFISGEYKKDEEKMNVLFEYQINELIASNYYVLDLIEGEDFSFDEIDLKKQTMLGWNRNSINYKMYETMLAGHSNLDSIKVDKWNMTTKTDKRITILPERIRQLTVPNCPNDALRVLLFLYDKYKEITPIDQQVEIELLDSFVKYVKYKIRNRELQEFNRTPVQNRHKMIRYFHDLKSDKLFYTESLLRLYRKYMNRGFTSATKNPFAQGCNIIPRGTHLEKIVGGLKAQSDRDESK